MNKIYKVIFNRNKNRYEIVSELASSRGGKCKVKAGKQIAKLFMTGLLATFLSSVALAADVDVKVKYDAATGTIKIVKADDDNQVLASYAVGGNISPITSIGTKNPTGIIAIGDQSKAVQSNSIAIGANAHAGDNLTPAKGKDYPEDNSTGYIAIGTKAVASGKRSISLGNESSTNKGSYNIAQGNDAISIGTSTSVFGYSGVSIGRRNIIGIPDPTLVSKDGVLTTKSKTKYSEEDPGGNSVIVGAYNVAYGNRSSIIGTYSRAMGSNSVAIGSGVQSLSDGSIAIGKGSGYEFEDGSRFKNGEDVRDDYYGRDWELPPEYKVLKQVLSNDINGDKPYTKTSSGRKGKYKYEKGGSLPKYNNYGAGSSDPGGFIVEGKNALGIGTYTQVRGDSAIGLATGEMTADLSDKDKSAYARAMRKIMDMEETLYDAKEALKAGTGDTAALESAVKAAEESLSAAKKDFRKTYLTKYSFVDGDGALGVGRQILAQGDRSMAVGDYAKAISSDAIAYGGQTLANGTNSMAMGGSAHVGTRDTSFDNSMAIGSHTNVQAGNAVALGAFSEVTGTNSLALGFGTQSSTDSNSITYNSVSGHDSTLIGSYGNIAGNNSILIGSSGSIANDRVVGLGNNINIEAADQNDQENNTAGSVFLGDHAGYVKDSKRSRSLGQVDVVGSAGKMELTESLSSTKGALRDYTKDFIYIYMLERQDDGTQIGAPIAVRSDFAGGDSTVGVVSVGSTYEQKFNSLQDIKDYHSKVGSLITVPVDVTVQVTKNGVPLGEQQQTRYFAADSTRDTIYADNTLSEEDKAKVWDTIQKSISSSNSTYTVFETRRIQNVAPGLIGLNSTDAINGSQLFATNQMLGNLVGSLKKTLGDSVTVAEDGQITVAGDIDTLGWIAKAGTVGGSNGTVAYDADKKTDETEEAYQARKAKLQKDGYIVDAAKVMTFKAGKNIGLVQKPGEFSISTIDTPSFTSVTTGSGDNTTVMNQDGVTIKAKTDNTDGTKTDHKTSITKDGLATDGTVKVTNGKTGDDAKDLVTIDKGTDGSGTDKEYGKIGLDGKNGSNATITVDRGTSSLDDTKNIGTDPNQDISKNNPAKMDRITYTTKNKDDKDVITHEVATMDDGLFFSGDSADGKEYNGATNTKNTFGRKLSEEAKIVGGVTTPANLTDNNIGVVSNGSDTLTIKLAKQLTGLDSATYTSPTTKTDDGDATSTMKVDGNGIRFVGDNNAVKTDAPSLTTDGIDGGNKQITNIGSGLKNGDTTISISDLKDPNKVPPTSPVLNNAVNVGDLKNIIDTGFKLNTSGQGTAGATTVRIGDTIKVVDGANTKVSAIDDSTTGTYTFHIDVNGLPMSYVDSDGNPLTKIGDKFYKTSDLVNGVPPAGTDEVPANKVTSNVSMLDNTGSHTGVAPQIKNVGSGLVDNNGKTIKPNELLNITDTNNPVLKNAVNVGDLKQVAAAAKTEVTGTGEAFVTRKQATDGHTIYNVHVDKILSHKDANGNELVRGGDGKYYTNEEIKDKTYIPSENKWYSNSDLTNGKPNQGAQAVTPAPVDQSNVKTSLVNPNAGVGTGTDTSMTLDNVKSGIGGDAGNGIKDGTTVDGTAGNNTFIKKLEKVGGTGEGAIDKTTVVNAGDLKNLADTPLFFSGDAADGKEYNGAKNTKNTFGRKLSEEAKIVGGVTAPANLTDNNIGVVSNGSDTLTIKLAKQLIGLDSATYTSPTTKADDGNVTSTMKVDGNGIRFVGDNNAVKTDAPSLTTDGITGGNKQITNVGSGLKDGNTTISISDLDDPEKVPNTSSIWNNAVNVGDLKKAKDAATTEITGTGKAIVTKTVGNKGQNIYNVHVDPVVDVVATDGKTQVVRGDDGKYYNPTDIADKTFVSDGKGGGSWYNNSDLTNGEPNQGAKPQNVTPTDVKNNFVNPNGTDSIVLDNVKSGIGGEVKDAAGKNTFIDNINKVSQKNPDGTVAPDAISENTVVNAKDLKNVVDTGFKLNTSGHNGDAQTVKIGDTIKVVDGANTKVSDITSKDGVHEFHIDVTGLPMTYTVSQTGGTDAPVSVSKVGDTYQLADGTKLVKVGDKFYKPSQLVDPNADQPQVKPEEVAKDWTVNDSISLVNKDGSNNAPTTLKNVGSGLKDANGNSTTLDQAVGSNAVNVDDLRTLGKAATTEVTGTGAAEVTKVTGANGQNIYNVHVDKLMTVKPVDPKANITRGGDGKYYNTDDIKDKTFVPSENKWYNTVDVDAKTGKPLEGKSALAKQPIALDQSKLKNSVVNPNGDGATIVDNVKSGIGGEVKDTSGKNTFIDNINKVGKKNDDGTVAPDAISENTVVNAGDLKNLADTPLFFSGDAADGKEYNGTKNAKNTFGRKLSEEAKIVGGVTTPANLTDNNIGVVSNGSDTLTVKLAKELTNLTSVTTVDETNGTKTTVSGKGITTDGKVVVNNGKTGDEAKEFVTIDKGTDGSGTDKEYGKIGLDGKNGSNATITIDRGTKSITDEANVGENPSQPVSGTNKSANMDRITYTTKGDNGNINHEVATLDDGFMLTTSTDIANSKAPANVKLNNTIKFTDGANTKVSTVTSKGGVHELHVDVTGLPVTYTATKTDAQGNVVGNPVNVSKVDDTYQDAAGNKLIKVGNKYYRPDQLVDPNVPNPEVKDAEKANGLTITDSISLVNNNGTTNPTTLKNVGSGLKDANGNATTLDQAVGSNAVNVDDLRTMGKAATTEVTGTGAAEVTKVTGTNGQNIYNVHVDKLMTVKPVDANTNIARGGDGKYYNAGDIAGKTFVSDGQGGGSWYDANDVDQATGKPKTEDDGITPKQPLADQPQAVDQNMLKNSVVNPNGDGPTVLDNVKSGIGGKVVDPEHENKNTFMENVDTIGKANGISENTVVNAGDLKNLVDTGFKLNTSGHSGDAQTVKIGETIKVVDGANTKVSDITSKDGVHEFHIDVTGLPMTYTVSQTGNASTSESVSKVGDTYQLADGTKLVKVGDKFYKPSQLVDPNAEQLEVKPEEVAKDWSVNDSVSLVNKDGSTNAPTLKNVGSGLKDANGNATTLDKAVGSNAVNVDDLRTMGKAATTEVTGTGAAEVTKTTGADGQNIYNVHVDKLMTVKPVDANTTIARGGDGKYYNASDIAGKTFVSDGQGGGSWYDANDVDQATGKPKTEDDGITPKQPLADQPQAVDQNMLKNSVVNPNGNDPTVLDNVKSGIGGDAGNGIKNGSTIDGTTGNNTFIENLDKVGKPANEGGIDKTTVVNAGDLKNLADTPLFFSGDSADGVAAADGTDKNTFSRKLSQETKIVGGVDLGLQAGATAEARKKAIADKLTNGNIGVISDGTDTLTIKLAKDLTGLNSSVYTSLTPAGNDGDATSSMKLDGNGIRFIDGQGKAKTDAPSLTTDGIKGGNKQITNIGSGLRDRQGKPVTLKNASEDILNNAVNVRDLRDVVQGLTDSGKGGGFGLTGNNGEVHKSLGETITLKGGIANKIENGIDMNKPEKATTDKNTYIDVKTSKNGSEKIMVVEIAKDLTDLNSAEFTDQEGNTTKMKGDGIYIDKNGDGNADISLTSEGLNNGGNKITNVADGTEDTDAVNVSQLNKLKQEIKQNIGDEINELNAYAPVVYSDKDGNRVIRKGNKFVKKNDETVEILPQDIRLSLVNADGKTTNPSTLQNVAKGVDKTDAVNVEQLKDATEKPLTFNGDAGSSSAKLGETVAIKGGANSADLTDNNIGVIADSTTKTLNVKLSKKLKGLESAEFVDNNGNTTNITGDGVHISGGNGSNVSLTSQGLNNGGNRITNVAPGVEATDAVNVSQLNQVGAALHNRINNVAKGAYGGVASAGAMASLPQAYLPGKSMVAAGASHYRGESAVALGASRISDNGKIILKLNASHNTSGNTMVGAGVGYQF